MQFRKMLTLVVLATAILATGCSEAGGNVNAIVKSLGGYTQGTYINLQGVKFFPLEKTRELANEMRKMKHIELNMANCKIEKESLDILLSTCGNIYELHLTGADYDTTSLLCIPDMRTLKKLSLGGPNVILTEKVTQAIVMNIHIEELQLPVSTNTNVLKQICCMSNLSELSLPTIDDAKFTTHDLDMLLQANAKLVIWTGFQKYRKRE